MTKRNREEHDPRRRPVLRVLGTIAVGVLGVIIGAFALGGGPGVGHFTSGEGRDAYLAAYFESQAEGPEPDAALDIRTDWGVVRV